MSEMRNRHGSEVRKPDNPFHTRVERYDRWYDRYPGLFQSELAAIRRLLAPRGRGLEVGVGTGRFAVQLGIQEGVDPSVAMGRIAEARGVRVACGRAESLPFPDGTFDFLLLVTTACFLREYPLACREMYRVLIREGAVAIGFIDADGFLARRLRDPAHRDPFFTKARFLGVKEVSGGLKEAGFCDLGWVQTLFPERGGEDTIQPVEAGWGRGGFVVVKGRRK